MNKNVEVKNVDGDGNPTSSLIFPFSKFQGIEIEVVDKKVAIDILMDSGEFLEVEFPFIDNKTLNGIVYFFEALTKKTEEEWLKNPLQRLKLCEGIKMA